MEHVSTSDILGLLGLLSLLGGLASPVAKVFIAYSLHRTYPHFCVCPCTVISATRSMDKVLGQDRGR